MSSLAPESRVILLKLARQAIESAVARQPLETPQPNPDLDRRQGAFVTLTHYGRLRGCIGRIEPTDLLPRVVMDCAAAAATRDPRFPPVPAGEVPELEIELSILSAPFPTRPEQIEIGLHGLIASRDGQRGLLLPQVADEQNWPVERFLEETCLKAGLDPYAWKQPGTTIEAFTAEVFNEHELADLLRGNAATS